MLYQLLSGAMPYVESGELVHPRRVLIRVLEGPPAPLSRLARDAPAELVAICEHAMARDPADRYADMGELGEELRAFLEMRVVRAYETGALAELKKWVRRNRALAAMSAAAVLALGVGLVVSTVLFLRTQEGERRLLGLSDVQRLDGLLARSAELWPPSPAQVGALHDWVAEAERLEARLREVHAPNLQRLRADGEGGRFAAAEVQWHHDVLAELVGRLEALSDPTEGPRADVARRLAFARSVLARSVTDPEAVRRWSEAIASIADEEECPLYGGLEIVPQVGLLPVGRNAAGLWEFHDLFTGDAPENDEESGALAVTEQTGVVFVLIPAGTDWIGGQPSDPNGENFDATIRAPFEQLDRHEFEPFFLSKYEVTQAQWQRATGENASQFAAGFQSPTGPVHSALHPAEMVSWRDGERWLARLGWSLPTGAEWEYAARAGRDTPWSTGPDKEGLRGAGNFADEAARRDGQTWPEIGELPGLDDGYPCHAPVGLFQANDWGLFDVHGNVSEWVADEGHPRIPDPEVRFARGGSFYFSATMAKLTMFVMVPADYRGGEVGLRPKRALSEDDPR